MFVEYLKHFDFESVNQFEISKYIPWCCQPQNTAADTPAAIFYPNIHKTEMHITRDPINWNNWIEESISKRHIKYYEYKQFSNIQEIGIGSFGRVYRANWRNSEQYFALKSFFDLNEAAIKELVYEVII